MVMMISYMIDKTGYLIINREVVSQDIGDFEYTPKPEFEGPFTIFNEANETELLRRFFEHIQEVKPSVISTFNGDSFDWPFVQERAQACGFDLKEQTGFSINMAGEFTATHAVHMDAYKWVKRDSYLPAGSQGLKAVTTAKLGYNPLELDPEDMTRFAKEDPQTLASYSVSDAVATFYLYTKYVHPFIFSLCNIIPLNPDEVLRKGSGTLCETLLMVEAFKAEVIMPNKQVTAFNRLFEGHLIESETYVGGHVEALEAGVFRADLPVKFWLQPAGYQKLIDGLDSALTFELEVEGQLRREEITNYDEIRDKILTKLEALRDNQTVTETPLIYHLDVAAMYPNIILTNRLQPPALIDEATCAACDFNTPDATCQRPMKWSWRGQFYPASKNEMEQIRGQLEAERFPSKFAGGPPRSFHDLAAIEQQAILEKRLADYSRKVYKRTHLTKVEERESTVCMRENSFYIDTVRAFRDRRYEYKDLHKTWKKNNDKATESGDVTKLEEAKKMVILYDSLQLAHKCILNSFYGYVMRKGARWYSMEMAGIVCQTGADIIKMARELVEQVGRPLELDTDGIWCILPHSFPDTFTFESTNPARSKFKISYPCAMLNHLVHASFTNDQYLQLVDKDTKTYVQRSENSIFFEVDGPYRAMILPSSKEEDRQLKKRYAVFNHDGSLAELKGFEVKRRGELKMIKVFQTQIFSKFLEGTSLDGCYESVGAICNHWLDLLYTKGKDMLVHDVIELLSENRSMSRTLDDYGAQKSTSISTAKRLAEFLGDQMVKDKGLTCQYIISEKPFGTPVTERAVPVAIFSTEESVKKHYLRKWLKDSSMTEFDIRGILDWSYYIGRLSSTIQKLVTIPAALQKVTNPVPRVRHPDWLYRRVTEKDDVHKQAKINDMFSRAAANSSLRKQRQGGEDGEGNDDQVGGGAGSSGDDSEVDDNRENTSPNKPKKDITDMEDIVPNAEKLVPKTSTAAAPRPIVHKRKRAEQERAARAKLLSLDPEPLPEEAPDRAEDYIAWLAYSKVKWRNMRKERKVRRLAEANGEDAGPARKLFRGANGASGAPVNTGFTTFFQRQARSLVDNTWEVLQVIETETPGEFRLWALVDKNLHSVRLTVPRVFYVNSRVEAASGAPGERVYRGLPRSHPCHFLYRFEMPETEFQQKSKELTQFWMQPSVEGVYESKVPLLFRALMMVGATCGLSRRAARRANETEFSLEDMVSRKSKETYMMPASTLALRYVFLYHSFTDSRHVVALFYPQLDKASVFLVGSQHAKDQVPNVPRLYAEQVTNYKTKSPEALGSTDLFAYPDSMKIDVHYHAEARAAFRAVSQELGAYHSEKHGPTLVLVQSLKNMRALVPRLADFPFVLIPANSKDNQFTPLDWQRHALRRMLSSFLVVNQFILDQTNMARYANLPLGNLETDSVTLAADVIWARSLHEKDMLLWVSTTGKPDLGGKEQDDNSEDLEDWSNPEVNNPGSYKTIAIELELFALAFSTVLTAPSSSSEIEGIAESTNFMDSHMEAKPVMDEGKDQHPTSSQSKEKHKEAITASGPLGQLNLNATSLDDFSSAADAFATLKQLVQSWTAELVQSRNPILDTLLGHFYRWIKSSSSRLYDPAIHKLVHNLMKRLFLALLAEFKRLGATIIHANFNRIILGTTKTSYSIAVAYCAYITTAIRKKPLFKEIEFKQEAVWDSLLWMDPFNHGGLHSLPPDSQEQQAVQMNWNVAQYLPQILQGPFQNVVAEFIYKSTMAFKDYESSSPVTKAQSEVPSYVLQNRELVVKTFSGKLFKLAQDVHKNWVETEEFAFPKLAGSHLVLANRALEFIKTVCAVLSLDAQVENEVYVLKKNLLSLVAVNEFSEEAIFRNPCLSFRLNEVFCDYCSLCSDVDLCRDEFFCKDEKWTCRLCGNEYNKPALEEELLKIAQRTSASYLLQDLKCTKCGMIKMDNIPENCSCSGRFITVQPKKDFLTLFVFLFSFFFFSSFISDWPLFVFVRIRTFHNLATFHQLPLLEEACVWTLTQNGQHM